MRAPYALSCGHLVYVQENGSRYAVPRKEEIEQSLVLPLYPLPHVPLSFVVLFMMRPFRKIITNDSKKIMGQMIASCLPHQHTCYQFQTRQICTEKNCEF